MKIFVTGHRGYIGSHLVQLLKEHGFNVTGCDLNLFEGCEWEALTPADVELKKDIRLLTERDLEGHDAVMHLAAISNDPMGNINPELTLSVNRDASIRLAHLAKRVRVSRFLFSGSCSVYGQGQSLYLDEDAALNPLTPYAQSKIETERALQGLADENFSPVLLRNATAFGHSPMLRFDLVANNLLAWAYTSGEIRIMSDGTPWRPLIHCKDIARAFIALLEADKSLVHARAINIGGNKCNYQVKEIGGIVKRLLPDANIVYTGEVGNDPRNYCVNFNLLNKLLPNFKLEYDLESGVQELFYKLKQSSFSKEDFDGGRFIRLKVLQKRLHRLLH